MTISLKNSDIAVIGNDVLVNGLRLAGVKRCYNIAAIKDCDIGVEVKKALKLLLEQDDVAIIILLEQYAAYAQEMLDTIRESKRTIPVIVEIPSIQEIDCNAVKKEYKQFARKYLGFELEI
jgi:vacuolar-type H+-ATPase subunit F/Vma7